MVEHNLAKVGVEGSNPFARSKFIPNIKNLRASPGESVVSMRFQGSIGKARPVENAAAELGLRAHKPRFSRTIANPAYCYLVWTIRQRGWTARHNNARSTPGYFFMLLAIRRHAGRARSRRGAFDRKRGPSLCEWEGPGRDDQPSAIAGAAAKAMFPVFAERAPRRSQPLERGGTMGLRIK